MNFDIHSHLIPNIDDGAKSIAESLEMLQILKGEGVDNILATPHFYPSKNPLDGFLARRRDSFAALIAKAEEKDLPKVHLGCELYYYRGMADLQDLAKLRIGDTNYILIELPYGGVSDTTLDDILNFSINFGLTPIFAHLERFGIFKGFKKAVAFVEAGNALAQVNAYSFFDKRLKKYAALLAKKNLISFLGSDLHSPDGQPMFQKALGHLRMLYPHALAKIESSSDMLFEALNKTTTGK